MKQTAEEFLKERCPLINDPKGVSHFTGDFVIQMMDQYAASLQPQTISEDEIEKVFTKYSAHENSDGDWFLNLDDFKVAITALQGKEQRGEEG